MVARLEMVVLGLVAVMMMVVVLVVMVLAVEAESLTWPSEVLPPNEK